jgi:Helix-turn-helix domain
VTQRDVVLHELRAAGTAGVSSDRFCSLGVYRYSARILELREQGHTIRTVRLSGNTYRFVLTSDPAAGIASGTPGPASAAGTTPLPNRIAASCAPDSSQPPGDQSTLFTAVDADAMPVMYRDAA